MFSKFFSYLFSKIMGSKEESQKTELVELDQVTADELLTSLCQEAVESGEIEVVPEPISVSDKIDVARMFNEFGYLDTKASESFIDKELMTSIPSPTKIIVGCEVIANACCSKPKKEAKKCTGKCSCKSKPKKKKTPVKVIASTKTKKKRIVKKIKKNRK